MGCTRHNEVVMVLARTAKLDGFEGTLIARGANGGEWSADLDPDVLVALLQAAATGGEVCLDDASGVRNVVIRKCWYDVRDGEVRAAFETSGLRA